MYNQRMNIAAVKVIITLHHSVRLKRQGEAMRNLQKNNFLSTQSNNRERKKSINEIFWIPPLR